MTVRFKDLKRSDFSSFFRSNNTHKENLTLLSSMLYEQLINKWINYLYFTKRIRNDIEKYKAQIIQKFYKKDFDLNLLSQITFELIPSNSETHN